MLGGIKSHAKGVRRSFPLARRSLEAILGVGKQTKKLASAARSTRPLHSYHGLPAGSSSSEALSRPSSTSTGGDLENDDFPSLCSFASREFSSNDFSVASDANVSATTPVDGRKSSISCVPSCTGMPIEFKDELPPRTLEGRSLSSIRPRISIANVQEVLEEKWGRSDVTIETAHMSSSIFDLPSPQRRESISSHAQSVGPEQDTQPVPRRESRRQSTSPSAKVLNSSSQGQTPLLLKPEEKWKERSSSQEIMADTSPTCPTRRKSPPQS